ncbi:MAG: hypothetical protein WBM02_01175 [bacterium]
MNKLNPIVDLDIINFRDRPPITEQGKEWLSMQQSYCPSMWRLSMNELIKDEFLSEEDLDQKNLSPEEFIAY